MEDKKEFQPVFIVGSARSGTTMIGKLLFTNQDFYDYRAETLIMTVCRKKYGDIFNSKKNKDLFLKDWFESRQFKRSNLNEKEFKKLLDRVKSYANLLIEYLREMAYKADKKFIVDSTPANVKHIHSILSEHPNAKFIWMIRDGRDVTISQEKLGWVNPPPPFNSKADKMHYALLSWKLTNKTSIKNKKNVFILRYEDFLQKPNIYVERISDFLDTRKEYFDIEKALDPKQSNSAFGRIGKESNTTPIERWRELEEDFLENFTFGCGNFISRLNYPKNRQKYNLKNFIRYIVFRCHITLKNNVTKIYFFSKRTSEELEK
ncbi:sulfotransferase [Salinimonas marina]|uniref:Sulfotransferase n=1 Tax=Salinimonas marina TaxID=2785918 RepID=A0A7S9DYW1_9ALTE|nr:sulfotransferase [Salinimonas marina]QPG06420.1 sulfotransferase [Salinimonas marina]